MRSSETLLTSTGTLKHLRMEPCDYGATRLEPYASSTVRPARGFSHLGIGLDTAGSGASGSTVDPEPRTVLVIANFCRGSDLLETAEALIVVVGKEQGRLGLDILRESREHRN